LGGWANIQVQSSKSGQKCHFLAFLAYFWAFLPVKRVRSLQNVFYTCEKKFSVARKIVLMNSTGSFGACPPVFQTFRTFWVRFHDQNCEKMTFWGFCENFKNPALTHENRKNFHILVWNWHLRKMWGSGRKRSKKWFFRHFDLFLGTNFRAVWLPSGSTRA
jgi:hypothetical protein